MYYYHYYNSRELDHNLYAELLNNKNNQYYWTLHHDKCNCME